VAEAVTAPNFTLKLVRPGFGPAAELPTLSLARGRHGGCSSRLAFYERHSRQPPRRSGFGTWAVAAQLSVRSVRRTETNIEAPLRLWPSGESTLREREDSPHMSLCIIIAKNDIR
jgi:hypothetical protein